MTLNPPSQNSAGVDRKLMIVDDVRDYADSIAEILEWKGYHTVIAGTASDAMEIIKGFDAKIVLLDIRLGDASGMDLIMNLKAIRPEVYCIMMTAYAAVDTAIQAIQRGAYAYLRKPIVEEELFATLERCFQTIQLQHAKDIAEKELKRKHEALQEVNKRLRRIVETSKRLIPGAYGNRLENILLEEFIKNLSATGGVFFAQKGSSFEPFHTLGDIPESLTAVFPRKTKDLLATVLTQKEPLLISHLHNQLNLFQTVQAEPYAGSLLVFPLEDETGDLYGLILLYKNDTEPFTIQDRELGALLASFSRETHRTMKAVENLKRSESEYRRLFDNLPDVFYRTDLRGDITLTSPSIKSLLGYTPDQVIGKNLFKDFFKNAPLAESLLTSVKDMNCPRQFNGLLVAKDGSDVWISASARYFQNSKGNISGIEGIARDVTGIRQSEEERMRLFTAIEQAAELIFITDPDGTIQYVNPSFEQVTGYSRDEVIGRNPRLLKSGKHDEAFYKQLWETINRGEVWKNRLINKKKDGTLYHEEATISPIRNGSNRIINYVAVKRDVTKESMLEGQLRQSQKMEAIGTLAGGIAHDFNNILSSIIGYSELTQIDIKNQTEALKHLDRVLKASYRAKDLVRQILSFSRREEHELMAIDMGSILSEIIKLLRASLPATVEIQKNIQTDQRLILADPTQIHQVLMNISTNAGHAMRAAGGTLTLTLAEATTDAEFSLRFQGQLPENYMMLTIQDTGHGMQADVLERIFDPYFTTKEKGEGTGLGLAIVHGIIQRHQGHITVHSEPNKGARFQIYLPHADRKTKKRVPQTAEPIPIGTERILMVDDEEDIISIGKQMLERLGYQVVTFQSGIEALRAFEAHPDRYDMVITDMTMPSMTGDQLAIAIKRLRPNLPVLLCTGYNENIDNKKASKLGIDGFLMKPVSILELAKALRAALNGKDST